MAKRVLVCLFLSLLLHGLLGYYLYLQKNNQKKVIHLHGVSVSIQKHSPLLLQPPIVPSFPAIPVVPTPIPKPLPPKKTTSPKTKQTQGPKRVLQGAKPTGPSPKPEAPPPIPKGEEGKEVGKKEAPENAKAAPTNSTQPGPEKKGEGGGKENGQGQEGSSSGTPLGEGRGTGGKGTGKEGQGQGKSYYTEEDGVKKLPENESEECGNAMEAAWHQSDEYAEGKHGDVLVKIFVSNTGKVTEVKLLHSFSKSEKISAIAIGNLRFNPRCRFSPAIDHQGNKVAFLIERYTVHFEPIQ